MVDVYKDFKIYKTNKMNALWHFFLAAQERHTLATSETPSSIQKTQLCLSRTAVSAGISVAAHFADSLLASV